MRSLSWRTFLYWEPHVREVAFLRMRCANDLDDAPRDFFPVNALRMDGLRGEEWARVVRPQSWLSYSDTARAS
jgi:hypothetical protein